MSDWIIDEGCGGSYIQIAIGRSLEDSQREIRGAIGISLGEGQERLGDRWRTTKEIRGAIGISLGEG